MRYPLVLLFVLSLLSIHAQEASKNLVKNPSFEDLLQPDKKLDQTDLIEKCTGWNSPNQGNPEIFTTTSAGYIYDGYGSNWSFKARTGKHVAGLDVHGSRDYIQGTLNQALETGKKYYFSFWVHYHCEGANNIGIAFIPNKMKTDDTGQLELKPATYQSELTPYDSKNTWTLVRDSFVAYKPYESFVIGNFFSDDNTKLEGGSYGHYFAYIDDILVIAAEDQALTTTENTEEEKEKWAYNETLAVKEKATEEPAAEPVKPPAPVVEPDPTPVFTPKTPVSLNNIQFDQSSAKLTTASLEVLAALAKNMQENPDHRVIVKGHASSEGTPEFNKIISANRAQIVVEYLTNKGISIDRILMQALGANKPVAPNDTEENRRLNRRVELEILN